MATSQTCCHLPGELLNSAAECADRARIESPLMRVTDAIHLSQSVEPDGGCQVPLILANRRYYPLFGSYRYPIFRNIMAFIFDIFCNLIFIANPVPRVLGDHANWTA
jgi:hypothetical protein